MTNALANAEKRVRDVHSQLDGLAERRAKIAAQVDEARALEARLLKRSSDLSELAGVRTRVSAGIDLLDSLERQIGALEAERDGAEADLERESALEQLGIAGDAAGNAQEAVLAEISALVKTLREPLERLMTKHGALLEARGVYDRIGAALEPAWVTAPGERPPARRAEIEGLLKRRGFSVRGADPEGPKRPQDADAATAAIWSLYSTVRREAWARAEIAKQNARREAEQEKQRRREEAARLSEIVTLTFPRDHPAILEALPGHVSDRRSHREPGGERRMMLSVRLERRFVAETLAALSAALSPDDYGLIALDDDGGRPVPTPLAAASDLKKSRVLTRPDPRALR